MPIYEYQCESCAKISEVLQKTTDPAPKECQKCGKENTLHKIISNTSFQLKGGGWYSDLYASPKPTDSKAEKPASCEPSCSTNACAKNS